MIAVLQRVAEASVDVAGETIASIGPGVLALVAVEQGDGPAEIDRMAERLVRFRLFADSAGRMNLDLVAAEADLLLVPQFTLAADTDSGHRPSFSSAAPPGEAREMFAELCDRLRQRGQAVATGRFGAHMKVALVNDGPVTFSLRVRPSGA